MQAGIIGIIADSHSCNDLLRTALERLGSLGATRIVHLGDICDSLKPQALPEARALLQEHGVVCVLGNNEYTTLNDNHRALDADTRAWLQQLPYTHTLGAFCFTHSAPFPWPAATRRPLAEFLPGLHALPYRIVFRGHSHTSSVIEVHPQGARQVVAVSSEGAVLERTKTYVITVGAVENRVCACFDPSAYVVRFLGI